MKKKLKLSFAELERELSAIEEIEKRTIIGGDFIGGAIGTISQLESYLNQELAQIPVNATGIDAKIRYEYEQMLHKIDTVRNSPTNFTMNYGNENGFYHSDDNGYNILIEGGKSAHETRIMSMHEINHAYQVVTGQINGDTTVDPNLMEGYDADKEFEAYRDQFILNNPRDYFLNEEKYENNIWEYINDNYDFGGTFYDDGSTTMGSTTMDYSTTGF